MPDTPVPAVPLGGAVPVQGTPLPTAVAQAAEPGPTRAQQVALAALCIALLLLGLWTLHRFVAALAWAVIFAIATWPTYQRVRRRWPPKGHDVLVPALFTLAIALLFLVPLALAAVQLSREAQAAYLWVREMRRAGAPVPDWVQHLPFVAERAAAWWRENLGDAEHSAALLGRIDRSELLSYGREFGLRLVNRAVLFGFTLVALFFLFRDGDHLVAQMRRAGNRAFGPHGERVAAQVVASVHGTVDGLVLVGIGEGILIGIAYAVAGVPHPALLGAVTGIAAMIPFAAPVVFGAAALLLVAQEAYVWAIAVFVFGAAVVFIADHFVRPVLIGGATRLPFLWVLLGILGGVEVYGLLGLFLGPAVMATLVMLWREWADGPVLAPPAEVPAAASVAPPGGAPTGWTSSPGPGR